MPAAMRSRQLILVVALVVASVAATAALAAGSRERDRDHRPAFDLQAHRGGLALRPENTLPAFEHAMRLGVSTIELDVQITEDGQAVVTHDRQVTGVKCRDTAPATPGDPEFPYVGKYVNTLTLAQVKTLDCGTRRPADPRTDPYLPTLVMKPGERMPTLEQVLELVKRRGDRDLKLNIETKVEAGAPHETAPREQFVQVVAAELRRELMLHRVTIQSFDCGGDPVAAVDSFGADAISPLHGDPQGGAVYWPEYRPFTTRDLVQRAHRAGLEVIPWTVNDRPTMEKLIDDGVDGLITDFPDRLRTVLEERGYRLPTRSRNVPE